MNAWVNFHIEGEIINFFGQLQRKKIKYNSCLSNLIMNYGLSSIDVQISLEDVIEFLCIIYAKSQQLEVPLAVYTLVDKKWVLMDISQTIAALLAKQKQALKAEKRKYQKYTVLNTQTSEMQEIIMIPYWNNWIIKYTPGSEYSRIFETGSKKTRISFLVSNENPEAELEKCVAQTIQETLEDSAPQVKMRRKEVEI